MEVGMRAVLLFALTVGAAALAAPDYGKTLPFPVQNEMLNFYPRQVVKVDYLAQQCSKESNFEECKKYLKDNKGEAMIPMVGFENAAYKPNGKLTRANDVISLVMSGIGAATFTAGRCCGNDKEGKNVDFLPAFAGYQLGSSFWATVFQNEKDRGKAVCTVSTCAAPRYAFTEKEDNEHLKNPLLSVLLNEIVEFRDRNNDGKYVAKVDGKERSKISLKCLVWTHPDFSATVNKTAEFSGEISSYTLVSEAFDKKTTTYAGCKSHMNLKKGVVKLIVSATDRPTVVGVYSTHDDNGALITQKSMNVRVHITNYPYTTKFDEKGVEAAEGRPRLLFRSLLTSDDKDDAFFIMNRHTVNVKTMPHSQHKGYISWDPLALVKLAGAKDAVPAPLILSTTTSQQDSSVLPRQTPGHAVPYSALFGLYTENLLSQHVFRLDIAVGGMAYEPDFVEWNFNVAYGSLPFRKSTVHPGAVLAFCTVMLILLFVAFKKGWLVDYDWQTGVPYFDEEEMLVKKLKKEKDKKKIISHWLMRRCCRAPPYQVEHNEKMGYKYVLPGIVTLLCRPCDTDQLGDA